MALAGTVKRVAGWADRLVPTPPGVTILLYHRVGGGSDSSVDLPVDQFRAQIAHLAEHHRVVDLDSAVAFLRAGDADSSVVVTFDDGTADFAEHAVPVLADAGVPATLYVTTGFVESGDPFPWGAPPISWTALRDVTASGLITVGSHSHTHALFDRCSRDVAADELDRSIELIEARLGTTPQHFAYPKALPAAAVNGAEVRHRFVSAALARNRVNRAGRADLHRLWRTPVQRDDDHEVFAAKAAGGRRLEGEIRHAVAGVRMRGRIT